MTLFPMDVMTNPCPTLHADLLSLCWLKSSSVLLFVVYSEGCERSHYRYMNWKVVVYALAGAG